jgi:hypothetical protein
MGPISQKDVRANKFTHLARDFMLVCLSWGTFRVDGHSIVIDLITKT